MGAAQDLSTPVEDRLRAVGGRLSEAVGAVLGALPGAPLRPNQLVRALGVNRAVASKVLGATSRRDPLEVLHRIPGPEPLRRLVRAAGGTGVEEALVEEAEAAIAAFDALIRNDAGTRAALDALISSSLPGARERFELASKYSVFKGLSQLHGFQAELWVGLAVVVPSAEDPERHDLTWLNGGIAMQRLRRGVTARFSYKQRAESPTAEPPAFPGVLPLEEFCTNPPARLEVRHAGDTIQYTLPDDILGPQDAVDLFVVDHHPRAMLRGPADPGAERNRKSLFVEPAIPSANLLFDVLLHDDAFPGSDPRLVQFDTAYDGMANVNDPTRDIDRMDVRETIEYLGHDARTFEAKELPSYRPLLAHLCERFGWRPEELRGYRVRVQYPVYGWQVCLTFDPSG